ncbi:MAG: DUF1016 domain-containing protein [Candidatus Omnitrophica bacterium]|nr:DUF1016 domain-containing protein [Candidatus Omnitrophota bacterium]
MSASLAEPVRKRNNPALPDVRSYVHLRKQVGQTLEEGRLRAQRAVEDEKTKTYWQVGRLIDAHILEHAGRADYGKQVLKRLAEDLSTNQTLLYYALQFARSYANFPAPGKLTWSHYRALLPVRDSQEREKLETHAEAWGWSSRKLESAVSQASAKSRKQGSSDQGTDRSSGSENESADLYVYPLVRSLAPGANPRSLLLDLGFGCYREFLNSGRDFFSGTYVRSVRTNQGFDFRRFHGKLQSGLNVCRAWFESRAEKEMVWMQIDLGFGFFTRRKIRCRKISNLPGEGYFQKTRDFSKDLLSEAQPLILRIHAYHQDGSASADILRQRQ